MSRSSARVRWAVVNAAGGWVRQVAELAGAWLAAAPLRHQLLVTAALPDIASSAPITRILDSAVYLRPARGGLMSVELEAKIDADGILQLRQLWRA